MSGSVTADSGDATSGKAVGGDADSGKAVGGEGGNGGDVGKVNQFAITSIKTGGITQTGATGPGVSIQQATTGFNNLNQALSQVSAQSSFNGQ
jgi:hypothetical protein